MLKHKHEPACGDCAPEKDCTDGACALPVNNTKKTEAPKRHYLGGIFHKCAMCAGSGAGGLLLGHIGCIITPLVLAATGATVATAGMSVVALAFGAAATAGGLYAWHRLRGHQASKWEKRIVIGGALAGLALSAAFNLAGGHQHHHPQQPPAAVICSPEKAPQQPHHHH